MDDTNESSPYPKEDTLPTKSRLLYEETYASFKRWCFKRKITKTTEDALMTYFSTEYEPYKASTLWTKYSMLRITINMHEGIDISKFVSIARYIKKKGEKFKAKKMPRLTKENVEAFLRNADNEVHLLNKVILIFGVTGACNRQELLNLKRSNVVDHERFFLVKLVDAETGKERSFVISQAEHPIYLELIRSYMVLRPNISQHDRFFINYVRGKCTPQPVGVHRIGSVPSIVARFLELPDHGSYTCHSFRGGAPACGTNMIDILRQEGWRFSNPDSCPTQDGGRSVFDYLGQASTSGLTQKSTTNDSSTIRSSFPPMESPVNDSSNLSCPEINRQRYRTTTPTTQKRLHSSDNVAVKWKNNETSVWSHFHTLLQNEQYVDVKLSAEGRIIKCHKVILSSFSSYFDEVFRDTPPGHVPIIFLKGVPFWILELLIKYMYVGEFNIEEDKLPQILSVANELRIRGMEQQQTLSLSKSSMPDTSVTLEDDFGVSCSESESDATISVQRNDGKECVSLSKRPKLTPSDSSNSRASLTPPNPVDQTTEIEQLIIGPISPIKAEPPDLEYEDVPSTVSKQSLTNECNYVPNTPTDADRFQNPPPPGIFQT